jgi:hypothetical protein
MNEHNPIAARVTFLQQRWNENVSNNDYKIVRWLVHGEDIAILNGFFKLESTPHGSLEETFVFMLTDFESRLSFSKNILRDWLSAYQEDSVKSKLRLWQDFERFLLMYKEGAKKNAEYFDNLLFEMLGSFKQYENKKTNLVVGLIPRRVYDFKGFIEWIDKMLPGLPDGVAFLVVDTFQQEDFGKLAIKHKNICKNISISNLNTKGAYKQIATQGNPNDPQVIFRKCMFEMGEAAAAGSQRGVENWGEKMLNVTKATGDKSFFASAHLIYAGFLFSFKPATGRINELLDGGIKILNPIYKTKADAQGVLLQLYSYKAAHFSIAGRYENSINWFLKQGRIAVEVDQLLAAIGAYKNALLVAYRHQFSDQLDAIALEAFPIGYDLSDEVLKTSEFPIIAYHYVVSIEHEAKNKATIVERMDGLFGKEWQKNAKKNFIVAPAEESV